MGEEEEKDEEDEGMGAAGGGVAGAIAPSRDEKAVRVRALKKKLQREGVYREMKLRRHFEKPSEKRAREKAAAVRRARKMERKRLERDGGK